jgi:hypothetical protein
MGQSGSSSADPGMDVDVDLRPSPVGRVTQGSLIRIGFGTIKSIIDSC